MHVDGARLGVRPIAVALKKLSIHENMDLQLFLYGSYKVQSSARHGHGSAMRVHIPFTAITSCPGKLGAPLRSTHKKFRFQPAYMKTAKLQLRSHLTKKNPYGFNLSN
jgi:hypothetical protein